MSDGAHEHPALAELADQVGSVGSALLAVDGRVGAVEQATADLGTEVDQIRREGIDALRDQAAALAEQVGAVGRELIAARLEVTQLAGRLDELGERHAPTLVGAATWWSPSWADAIKAWEAAARPLMVERIYHGGQPTKVGDTGLSRAVGRHAWLSYKPKGAAAGDVDATRAFIASAQAAGWTPDRLTITIAHEPVDDMDGATFKARFDAHAAPWRAEGYNVVPIFTNWSVTKLNALHTYWPELASGVGVDHYHGDSTGNEPAVALAQVTQFARERGLRLYVGEFGVPASVSDGTTAAWLDKVRIWAHQHRPRLICYWNAIAPSGYDARLDGKAQALLAYKRLWDGLG